MTGSSSGPTSDVHYVVGCGPLSGEVSIPGDKSISHRALLIGALAKGDTRISGLSGGEDVSRTRSALVALGVDIGDDQDGQVVVHGSAGSLHAPGAPIDCGNSGTTMRLLAGVVAGYPWTTCLIGDTSLGSRPMDRVAVPLREMGATVSGHGERCLPPLEISGGALRGITYPVPVPSAQVKSAILLAGLRATGDTTIYESLPTRSHTEEMLEMAGADIEVLCDEAPSVGRTICLKPGSLSPLDLIVPGDPSQAAFWVVAGCIVPDSEIRIRNVYVGPGRRGFLDVLKRMGADVDFGDASESLTASRPSSPNKVDLVVKYGRLVATTISAQEIPGLIDEVPILALGAALADGRTVFHGVGELRVKESDRLSGIVAMLNAFGGCAAIDGDSLIVDGVEELSVPTVKIDSLGDHRMAMVAAVAAMTLGDANATAGEAASDNAGVAIVGWSVVATSYPGFADDYEVLRSLNADNRPLGQEGL